MGMDSTRFDRREFKFVVDALQRRRLTEALAARLTPDPHGDGTGRYPIISVYYDNASLDLFMDGLRGLSSRRKLRLRLYGDASTRAAAACFIEIKHRYKARVAKRRVELALEEAIGVGQGRPPQRELGASDALVVAEALEMQRAMRLRPTCLLRYERQAFRGASSEADLRVTFDHAIRARARDLIPVVGDQDFEVEILEPTHSILEIKVAETVPFWLARQLGALGCVRRSYSKYGNSVLALGLRPSQGHATTPGGVTADPTVTRAHLDALEASWTP